MNLRTDIELTPTKRPPPLRITSTPPKKAGILRPKAILLLKRSNRVFNNQNKEAPPPPRANHVSPCSFTAKAPDGLKRPKPKPVLPKSYQHILQKLTPSSTISAASSSSFPFHRFHTTKTAASVCDERFNDVEEEEDDDDGWEVKQVIKSTPLFENDHNPISVVVNSRNCLSSNDVTIFTEHRSTDNNNLPSLSYVSITDSLDEEQIKKFEQNDQNSKVFGGLKYSSIDYENDDNSDGPSSLQVQPSIKRDSPDINDDFKLLNHQSKENEDGETGRLSFQAKTSSDEGEGYGTSSLRVKTSIDDEKEKEDGEDEPLLLYSKASTDSEQEAEGDVTSSLRVEKNISDDEDEEEDDFHCEGEPVSMCAQTDFEFDDGEYMRMKNEWVLASSSFDNAEEKYEENGENEENGDQLLPKRNYARFDLTNAETFINHEEQQDQDELDGDDDQRVKKKKSSNLLKSRRSTDKMKPTIKKIVKYIKTTQDRPASETADNSDEEVLNYNAKLKRRRSSVFRLNKMNSKSNMNYNEYENRFASYIRMRKPIDEIIDLYVKCDNHNNNNNMINMLNKYIIHNSNVMEKCIKILLYDIESYDVPLLGGVSESNRLHEHRQVISKLFLMHHSKTNKTSKDEEGEVINKTQYSSKKIRCILFQSRSRCKQLIFQYIEKQKEKDFCAKCRVLISMIYETFKEDCQLMVNCFNLRKSFLNMLCKYYIEVNGVYDMIVKLVSFNNHYNEHILSYGSANPNGIILLGNELVCDTLMESFKHACNELMFSNNTNVKDSMLWLKISNYSKSIVEIYKRCMLLPKFNQSNCSLNAKNIKLLNITLESLNVFITTEHVGQLLQILKQFLPYGNDQRNENLYQWSHCISNTLKILSDSLYTIRLTSYSKNIMLKRLITSSSIIAKTRANIESETIQYVNELIAIISFNFHLKGFGRARISACEVLRELHASRDEDIKRKLLHFNVASRLITILVSHHAMKGTALHSSIFKCVQVSLEHSSPIDMSMFECWTKLALKYISGESKHVAKDIACIVATHWNDEKKVVQHLNLSKHEKITMNDLINEIQVESEEIKRSCGGPKPKDGPKICLLADAKSLAAQLDDVNVV